MNALTSSLRMPTGHVPMGPINRFPPAGSARDALLPEWLIWALNDGATWVRLELHPGVSTLTVTHDGAGVTDPWTWLKESPVAFLARPLAGRLELVSAFGELTVPPSEGTPVLRPRRTAWDGTTTGVLHQVLLTEHRQDFLAEAEFQGRLDRLAFGFPIPVIANGRELPRPHAATGSRCFLQSELGLVSLAGHGPGEDWRRDFTCELAVYVQGLPVFAHAFRRPDGPVNLVHLDPTRFLAAWPERNRLVDEDEALRTVRQQLCHLWQVRLAALKEDLPPDEFVRGYPALKTWGALELLRDVPYVSAPLLARFSEMPRLSATNACEYLDVVESALSRSDLERGWVRLGRLEGPEDSGEGFLRRMWAWKLGVVLIDDGLNALPPGHWVQPFVQDLDAATLRVELLDPAGTEVYDSPVFGEIEVRFCRAYRLTLDGVAVEMGAEAGYWADRKAVLMPAGETSGRVVHQIADFRDNDDRVDEQAAGQEETLFRLFLASCRTPDAVATLRALLAPCPLRNYPVLRGQRFRLRIDAEGHPEIEAD